jgi:hypothetical protein
LCIKIQLEAKKEFDALAIQTNKELACQFCSNKFKTKYLLNKHQTQTKYCLKIQTSEVIVKSFITCAFCNKNFSCSTFKRRDLSCKKKNQFLDQKDQENC